VDHGQHLASCDTSLVVSGGVDCGRIQQNVYDKKPQCYAKDNRTAHLTARSNKSVAYVTNNKDSTRRFVLLELTTETQSIARLLCDSRATCFICSGTCTSSVTTFKHSVHKFSEPILH